MRNIEEFSDKELEAEIERTKPWYEKQMDDEFYRFRLSEEKLRRLSQKGK